MNALPYILVLANIFNILDTITTIYAVKVLGFVEANFIMRYLMSKSVELYALFKILSLLVVSIIALKTEYIFGKTSYYLYIIAFTVTMMILCTAVVNNLIRILSVRLIFS